MGIRDRARAELVREITDTARRHLAERGAATLSVRAVTRELGMSPSAVYRYFPNRDALLTALILEAYQGVADAATTAESDVPRADLAGRWLAVFRAVRGWALDHPHEYALIYGSPVPGYVAPQDTAVPAAGVALLLARIAVDAAAGAGLEPPPGPPVPEELRADAADRTAQVLQDLPVESDGLDGIDPRAVIAVVDAWTMLFGTVSFELFGHYHRVVEARSAHLDHVARTCGRAVGIRGL
ncbi:TetR/AcrR family transcriptional regulator [Georgenia sp. SUBG003]|uniref:TetR/AcrR family transcriptional regulator n=1 Tax=Georgenia sp. SUBG003 TaxID=1497974 RepID=UPI0004D65F11|nr:TetR family transcriptional regulator [Georgenia sp. SUBG003]